VRLSHTLWGGRFNPVVMADRPEEARQLIELYRVDFIIPFGADPTVVTFPGQFPRLIAPYFPDRLFLPHQSEPTRAHLLDDHNAPVHWGATGAWKAVEEQGISQFVWDDDDPLDAVRSGSRFWEPVVARYHGKLSRIYVRADAGFANSEVCRYLEGEGINYAIRLPASRILQERIGYLLKRPLGRPSLDVRRSYAKFTNQAGSWTKPRRVVAKAEGHSGEL
jgi:Transposase DDE domain group 1